MEGFNSHTSPNMVSAGMSGSGDYMSRLLSFRQSDVDRDNMIQELIRRYEHLEKAYEEKCHDYDNEVESRRMWQANASGLKQKFFALKQTTESNPFVYAIIDGDGAVFEESLISKGAEGGAEAAYMLQTEIREYIKESYPETNIEDWSIIVQIVLNLDGLSKTLHASGVVPHAEYQTLANFGRAFGRCQPLFSFVDVGAGKESADHKIREMMRHMVRVSQCKHIFFGPCHDNGYLPVLEPYKRDTKVAPRLTLLETTPAEPGFLQLGFKMTSFPKIFRSAPLPSRTTAVSMAPPASSIPPLKPKIATAAAASAIHPPDISQLRVSSPPASASASGSGSWSSVSQAAGAVAARSIDIASKKKPARKSYLLNCDSERVDEPLPRTDPIAEKKFKELMSENRTNFCNSHYLLGNCDAPGCTYYHGDKFLPPGLLLVLKFKARGIMCAEGAYCTNPDCIYGHHCKWGNECTLNWCRFANTHDMDLTPHIRVFEDGSIQRLAH